MLRFVYTVIVRNIFAENYSVSTFLQCTLLVVYLILYSRMLTMSVTISVRCCVISACG